MEYINKSGGYKETTEKNRLEELREVILNAPHAIEEEFARTKNSWLECFGSSVFAIETYLEDVKRKKLLNAEQSQQASERLEKLKRALSFQKRKFPDRELPPSADVKATLLSKLDIFREANDTSSGMPKNSRDEVDHWMKNKIEVDILIGMAQNQKQDREVITREQMQQSLREFIEGMRETIQAIEGGQLEESPYFTRQVIKKLIYSAEHIDPTDENQVRKLYENYLIFRMMR
ncbi:MAG: hypothetical protein HY445_02785 [Candidatus Niyogibacteria bacterium]|nr:hypothetical protein [Candidatus Niyogibacteria bacterium]